MTFDQNAGNRLLVACEDEFVFAPIRIKRHYKAMPFVDRLTKENGHEFRRILPQVQNHARGVHLGWVGAEKLKDRRIPFTRNGRLHVFMFEKRLNLFLTEPP